MFSQGRPDEDEHGIRIHAGRHSDAYLQRASRQLGCTVVMWRGRHVAEPTELSETEASGYWLEVLRVAAALQGQYQPVKMNYQTLGNAVPHLTPTWCLGSPTTRRLAVRSRFRRGSDRTSQRTRFAGMLSRCDPSSERAVHAGPEAGERHGRQRSVAVQ